MLMILAAMAAGTADLPSIFQATCLDGQARLSAGQVSPSSFDQLPSTLRENLGRPASSAVWKFNSGGDSYLYMLDYGSSRKVCGLASDTMDLKVAGDMLESRVTGGVDRNRTRAAQWINAKDGYVATATTQSAYKVVQINWMSPGDKYEAREEMSQLPH
jgi:hypothetical protein